MEIPLYNDKGARTGQKLKLDPDWVIADQGLPEAAVDFAEAFGQHLADQFLGKRDNTLIGGGRNALSTTQLRNFFNEIRRIQLKRNFKENLSDFFMLKPKLAYATARVMSDGFKKENRIKDFNEALILLIDKVAQTQNPVHFENFTKFVEATVAYHKWYGGQ